MAALPLQQKAALPQPPDMQAIGLAPRALDIIEERGVQLPRLDHVGGCWGEPRNGSMSPMNSVNSCSRSAGPIGKYLPLAVAIVTPAPSHSSALASKIRLRRLLTSSAVAMARRPGCTGRW